MPARKSDSFLRNHWRKLVVAFFWILVLLSYFIYSLKHQLSVIDVLKQIVRFTSNSPWGPLIFIGLYILRPIFVFSASLLTIASGVLFGPFWGVVYAVIGANTGASLAYLIGRFFIKDFVDAGNKFQGYRKRMKDNSFATVFLMRLAYIPYDFVNYLAGSLGINYFAFVAATMLGSIPGTVSFVLFGSSAKNLDSKPSFDWRIVAVSFSIFLISMGLSKIIKSKEKNEIS